MNTNNLERHFDACNLPVQFVDEHPIASSRYALQHPDVKPSLSHFFYVDVDTDRKRDEYFRIYGADDVELMLMDKQPKSRHLLMQMRVKLDANEPIVKHHYLMGHDERQLFVVNADGTSSVRDAISALKPRIVEDAERRGLKVIRQGDWFFIPLPASYEPDEFVLRNTTIGGERPQTLGITVGNPHVAEEQAIKVMEFDLGRGSIRRRIFLTVRGKIRHDEHSTVKLVTWHQAIQSRNPALIEGAIVRVRPDSDTTIGYYD